MLGNDTDVEGSTLSAAVVDGPAHTASFTLNANGSYDYTPAANFNGTDSFTYRANDGTDDSNPATVTITVNPVNDAPVAADDVATTDEDTTLTVTAPGVLANDSDTEGSPLTGTLVSPPTSSSAFTFNADGSYSYTPAANFNGTDSFTYRRATAGQLERRDRRHHGERGERRAGGGRRRELRPTRTRRCTWRLRVCWGTTPTPKARR